MRKLRTLVIVGALLVGFLAGPSLAVAGQSFDFDKGSLHDFIQSVIIEKKAQKIHSKVLTLATHLDTPLIMANSQAWFGEELDLGKRNDTVSLFGGWFTARQVDFPRMQEGGLDAGFFVAYIGQGPRDDAGHQAAIETVLGLIDLIYEKVGEYPELAEVATEPKDAYRLRKQGKRAIYISIENGYAIGRDLSMIKTYYDLGVRYIGLSHSGTNDICDSSTDTAEHGGLSPFGEQVVAEMNRVGMMVDVSHVSDDAVWDVLEVTTKPIIASHSNPQAVYDHPRNINDDLLRAIADNGGVIMANFLYVKPSDPTTGKRVETVADVVDHIDHIVAVAGIDHVGIGTDYDGGGWLQDCEDVSKLEGVTLELVKRGYNKREIHKIWSGNLMRVFQEVQDLDDDEDDDDEDDDDDDNDDD